MAYADHTVSRLRKLLKEHGVRGYFEKRKAELIAMLQASDPPSSQQPQTWETTRSSHPTRPPRSKKSPKKRINQLERKKRNLEIRIRSNPKLRAKLRERLREPPPESRIEPMSDVVPETRINLIENQTRIKTYIVTGPLNHDISNLIFNTIHPVIKMGMKVIYIFSCTIYRGWNQVIHYHKTLSPNGTFISLSQIEEYTSNDVNSSI